MIVFEIKFREYCTEECMFFDVKSIYQSSRLFKTLDKGIHLIPNLKNGGAENVLVNIVTRINRKNNSNSFHP